MRQNSAWVHKTLAVCMGLAFGLVISECLLRAIGLPRFHKAHSAPPQFAVYQEKEAGKFFYLNLPSETITFRYDSNPRGYFKPGNIVTHETNRAGFRGPEFSPVKAPRGVRLAFFGDSFTFGEGVFFDDTFAVVTATLLQRRFAQRDVVFESYDLGVGGYNTIDETLLLKKVLPEVQPDVVVLCYVLNDAEPRLVEAGPQGGFVRRAQKWGGTEGPGEPTPPKIPLYRLRTAQLVWRWLSTRQRTRQTEAHYRSLYAPDEEGWKAGREALHEFASECKRAKVPLVVMIFPVLDRLDGNHPFRDIYAMVADEMRTSGALVVNLLPAFRGRSARDLWVHPTDQHPNEIAHRIAAEQLAQALASDPGFLDKLDAVTGSPRSR